MHTALALTVVLAHLALEPQPGQDYAVGEQPLHSVSPDGKSIVEARWNDKPLGYLCAICDAASGKTLYADPAPTNSDGLPNRLAAKWSPDSRYVALYVEYSHRVYGVEVFYLSHGKAVPIDVPHAEEKSMLRAADRPRLQSGMAVTEYDSWKDLDTLTVSDEMVGELKNPDGTTQHIDSSRDRTIQFIGKMAKVISTGDPVY